MFPTPAVHLDAATPDQCSDLISAAEAAGWAPISYPTLAGRVVDERRHKGSMIRGAASDVLPVLERALRPFVQWAAAAAQDMGDIGAFHSFQIIRYGAGDFMSWHTDSSPTETPAHRRKLAAVFMLTDPAEYDGGDLVFRDSMTVSKQPRGTAIVFPCFLPHHVTPVRAGRRYSAVVWYDGPPWR